MALLEISEACGKILNTNIIMQELANLHIYLTTLFDDVEVSLKPAGSHMPPTYLGRGRRHGLGQRCCICEYLSPTHNLSQTLIAGLPAKLNSTQLRRQVGGECLGQIMCRR